MRKYILWAAALALIAALAAPAAQTEFNADLTVAVADTNTTIPVADTAPAIPLASEMTHSAVTDMIIDLTIAPMETASLDLRRQAIEVGIHPGNYAFTTPAHMMNTMSIDGAPEVTQHRIEPVEDRPWHALGAPRA